MRTSASPNPAALWWWACHQLQYSTGSSCSSRGWYRQQPGISSNESLTDWVLKPGHELVEQAVQDAGLVDG